MRGKAEACDPADLDPRMCRVAGVRLAGETKHGLTAKVLECRLVQLADPGSVAACHIDASP
jgi:hypothetical protein